jgi:hypothetical protein
LGPFSLHYGGVFPSPFEEAWDGLEIVFPLLCFLGFPVLFWCPSTSFVTPNALPLSLLRIWSLLCYSTLHSKLKLWMLLICHLAFKVQCFIETSVLLRMCLQMYFCKTLSYFGVEYNSILELVSLMKFARIFFCCVSCHIPQFLSRNSSHTKVKNCIYLETKYKVVY